MKKTSPLVLLALIISCVVNCQILYSDWVALKDGNKAKVLMHEGIQLTGSRDSIALFLGVDTLQSKLFSEVLVLPCNVGPDRHAAYAMYFLISDGMWEEIAVVKELPDVLEVDNGGRITYLYGTTVDRLERILTPYSQMRWRRA